MTQRTRILIALAVILVLIGAVLGIDLLLGRATSVADLPAGAIPIYLEGRLIAGFVPDDLARLEEFSFIDAEEGKEQRGWLLRDVLLLYIDEDILGPDTLVAAASSSRGKTAQVTWAEVADADNMVMFDVSGRGTLKLISRGVSSLDSRDEWVQDVDRIDITQP
jgi:hypothetical protein